MGLRSFFRNCLLPFSTTLSALKSADFEKRKKNDFSANVFWFFQLSFLRRIRIYKTPFSIVVKKEHSGFLISIDGWRPSEFALYMTDMVLIIDRNIQNIILDTHSKRKHFYSKIFDFKGNTISLGYFGWEGNKKSALPPDKAFDVSISLAKDLLNSRIFSATVVPSPGHDFSDSEALTALYESHNFLHSIIPSQQAILETLFSDFLSELCCSPNKEYSPTGNDFLDFLISETCKKESHAIHTLKIQKASGLSVIETHQLSYNVICDLSFLDSIHTQFEYHKKMVFFYTDDRPLVLSWCKYIESTKKFDTLISDYVPR